MSSRQFDISSRVTRITAKSNKTEYLEVKIPQPSNDFHALYKDASGIYTGNANLHTIDVLPNFTPIIMFCIYHAASFSAIVDIRSHAKVSTATLAAYFLAIVYAHILAQDAYLRPVASPYGTEFLDSDYKREFLNYLVNLPVPDFLQPILKQILITTTDQRPNIVFCPSANGYDFKMHYGRFVPLNFFTHIHYIASTVQANNNVNTILAEYLTTSCLIVDEINDDSDVVEYTPANFLGINLEQGVMTAFTNKLYQSFLSVFNPVLLRSSQSRHTFAPVYIEPFTGITSRHSFYDAVFSSSVSNFSEYRTLFTSVAAAFNGVIPCKSNLADFFSTISGTGILQHGYSDFGIPTWYSYNTPKDYESYTARTVLQSDEQRAVSLKFLPHTPLTTGTEAFTYPTASADGVPVEVCLSRFLVLMSINVPSYSISPYGTKARLRYTSVMHFMPRVRVLHFGESNSSSAYLATLCGLVIESLDLDSSTVPHPDPTIPIGVENSLFFSSAIPYAYIKPGYDQNGNDATHALIRHHNTQDNPVFASHIADSAQIIVPRYTEAHAGQLLNNQLPGLTFADNIPWTHGVLRFLGGRASTSHSPRSEDNRTDPSGLQPSSLAVWSPYSYTCPIVIPENMSSNADANQALHRTYFFTNFRTLFGTDTLMTEVLGFLDAMPII